MDLDDLVRPLIVPPGKKISLKKDYDPGRTLKGVNKQRAENLLSLGVSTLAGFQDKLYAQDKHALLIIFQAIDAAGKDGAIKHVLSGVNPQGCQVFNFKAPSSEDLDHDYLWRCFKALPERGRIGIFNRSYYEEVVVVRVHPELIERQRMPKPRDLKDLWPRRYEEINNFEKYLTNNGIHVLKIFLHLSKEEQRQRFLKRLNDPDRNWKFSLADVKERQCWDDYYSAYEDMINETSTKWAPWHVIPADHKWFSRLCVSGLACYKLRSLDLDYPELDGNQRQHLDAARKSLEAEADGKQRKRKGR